MKSKLVGQSSRLICALRTGLFLLTVFFAARLCPAYSVLTHEEIVDLLWQDQIQPLLKKQFPSATEEDLRKAHAYAYGGSLVQDMGYYPFGNKHFSDLVHYVRSGDFVVNLIAEASNLNEYAFALGALSHYAADNTGHPTINRVVIIEFPRLRRRFGDRATYADDPKTHIRTEFGFDMVQVAKNRYTSDRYHDFIGFEVSKELLDRIFVRTYGLKLEDVFGDPLYYISRKSYEKEWGKGYRKPGVGTRILAFFLRLVPKVGPFRALAFKIPTTQTEDMYIKSGDLTIQDYSNLLHETKVEELRLPNKDCDTGQDTKAGEYALTDKAYEKLLGELADKHFEHLTPELQKNILDFYSDLNAPIHTKRNKKVWMATLANLEKLKAAQPVPEQPAKIVVLLEQARDAEDNRP